jgi:iron complex outermembrane receptor protein
MSGTVSDASGPFRASILVKGTSNGAQTDLDGKFTIRNVGANAVLIFTYIGQTTRSKCSWKTSVNVVLVADSAELQVIVIGYGTVKRKMQLVRLIKLS